MSTTAAKKTEDEITEDRVNGVREELEQLLAKHAGQITPAELVEAAIDSQSKLHSLFEWDDTIAGREYRLQQARVVLQRMAAPPYRIRLEKRELLNVNTENGRRYVIRSVVLKSDDLRGQEIERAWKYLQRFVSEWGDADEYPELERVTRAIRRAIPKTI